MLHTRRPGEVVVRSKVRVLVSDRALHRGLYDNPAWAVEADTPTILPTRVVKEAKGLEVLDVAEGVLPPLLDVNDNRHRAMWRKRGGGKDPGPDRPTLLAMARAKYGDYSLAEAIVDLVCAGWPERRAAEELIPLYDQSFLRAKVQDRPWTRRAADLIAAGR